jgi:predicted AlkP superfamily pyrophosphatase or phosphodiesterase
LLSIYAKNKFLARSSDEDSWFFLVSAKHAGIFFWQLLLLICSVLVEFRLQAIMYTAMLLQAEQAVALDCANTDEIQHKHGKENPAF